MRAFNFPVRHLDRQEHPRQPAGQTETRLATMGHETLYMHLYVKEGNQLTTNRSPWMPYGFTTESTKLGWDELNFNILYHRNRREIGGQGKALLVPEGVQTFIRVRVRTLDPLECEDQT